MVAQSEESKLSSQPLLKNLAISHILYLFAIKSGNKTNKPYQDTIYELNDTHHWKRFWGALSVLNRVLY